jgi:hypothetical protein
MTMKLFLAVCCFVALALLIAPVTSADIAKPKPAPSPETKQALYTSLEIVPDTKAYNAQLQMTQSQWQKLRASLDGNQGTTPIAASIANSPTRTIIAGVLLFLAVSFAGVFLARAIRSSSLGTKSKAGLAAVLIIATLGAAAVITRGNAGPPPYYRWRNLPTALAQGQTTTGELSVEIVPDSAIPNDAMRLIIPLRNPKKPGEE